MLPIRRNCFQPWNRGRRLRYPDRWRGVVGAWCPSIGYTGNQLIDFSGYNNHGTLTNMDPGTDWVPAVGKWGESGYALAFDGSDDHVDFSNQNFPSVWTDFKIGAWIRHDNIAMADDALIFGWTTAGGSTNQTLALFIADDPGNVGQLMMFIRTASGPEFTKIFASDNGITLNDGEWHYVVGQRRGSAVTLYIDGLQEGSGTQGTTVTMDLTDGPYIGDDPGITEQFTGLIDDVTLGTTVSSSDEVWNEYILGIAGAYALDDDVVAAAAAAAAGGFPFQYYYQQMGAAL